jgi:hypothetical protein
MVTPKNAIDANKSIILLLSLNTLISGVKASTKNIKNISNAIAKHAAIRPLIIERIFIGLAINHLVAPTICIVFIRKRLLYMASLMVLSIEKITSMVSRIAAIKKPITKFLAKLLTPVTIACGN